MSYKHYLRYLEWIRVGRNIILILSLFSNVFKYPVVSGLAQRTNKAVNDSININLLCMAVKT
jgi:hypothetical protein